VTPNNGGGKGRSLALHGNRTFACVFASLPTASQIPLHATKRRFGRVGAQRRGGSRAQRHSPSRFGAPQARQEQSPCPTFMVPRNTTCNPQSPAKPLRRKGLDSSFHKGTLGYYEYQIFKYNFPMYFFTKIVKNILYKKEIHY